MSIMPAPAQLEPPATLRAALWMIGSVASFSLMAVAGRAVSFELDTFEIMMYRSFVGFVIIGIFVTLTGSFRLILLKNTCCF
jgi:hypothetical protein